MKTFHEYKTLILEDDRSKTLSFEDDERNHYVYRITDLQESKHYYGSRVTKRNPEDDLGIKYFSSSSNKEFISNQKDYPSRFRYKILRTSDSHGDNILFESYLHQYFQVSSHNKFLNKCNQTPFGWTTTGNKDAAKKARETKSKVNSDTGTSIDQDNGKKAAETRMKTNPDTGTSIDQDNGKKLSKILSKVNPETGTSIAQDSAKKTAKTKSNINSETGTSIAQDASRKAAKTMSKINHETGTSIAQDAGKKISETINEINHETGTSIAQDAGKKRSGKNNYLFSGCYLYHDIEYITSQELAVVTGLSNSTVCLWCKRDNLKIISNSQYLRSKFLQSLGSREDIVGKTPKDLGFGFVKK